MIRLRLQQAFGVARLTAMETLRQPIALLLLTAAVLATAVLPLIVSHTLGDTARMIADSTLSVFFLFGLFLAGFAACHTLTEEARRGTAALVLSKPIPRGLFFLAKFAGIAAALALFSLACIVAILLAVRTVDQPYAHDLRSGIGLLAAPFAAFAAAGLINYLTRRPFGSDAFLLLVACVLLAFLGSAWVDREGQWTAFGVGFDFRMVRAGLLVGMALWVLAGLALAFATRLGTVPTVTLCAAIFLAGLMSDYLLGRAALTSRVAAFAYAWMPNWQHFWIADALHAEQPIPWRYVGRAAGYAAAYLLGTLSLGMIVFCRGEVKD